MSGLGRLPVTAGLLALGLSACSAGLSDLNPFGDDIVLPPCPKVAVLKDADKITRYRPGPGRDITDIEVEAEIVGFKGECDYEREDDVFTSVLVTLRLAITAARGPANNKRRSNLDYFVRIPQFFPRPEGSSVFPLTVAFPENRDTIGILDEEIELTIPLKSGETGADFDVFLGFVLNRRQLEFNRRGIPGL